MEENINQVLGIEEEEPTTPKVTSSNENNSVSAEETLNAIAYIVLILGLITGVICMCTICFIDDPRPYHYEKMFNPSGFATTIAIFLTSLATWALFRVIANISMSLKEIKNKIK